jgi:predicted Zn-dependent peptidase
MQPAQTIQNISPPTFTRGQLIRTKDLEQAHYVLALPCSGRTNPDYHTIIALLNILGGGMSSRLFQKAREELGLCYSIYTSASCQSDSGMFSVYAGTSPHQIRTLSHLVASELIAIKDTLTEKELTSTKTQMISCAIMSQESSSDRCERLASDITYSGKIQTLSQVVEDIKGITLEHAKAVAEKMFHTKDQVMVTYAPEADIPSLDELTEKMVA